MILADSITKTFCVNNATGLHARPASQIAKVAVRFDADVTIVKDGQRVNAKSVISILILAAGPGSEVTVETAGPEREQAMAAMSRLFETSFDEG